MQAPPAGLGRCEEEPGWVGGGLKDTTETNLLECLITVVTYLVVLFDCVFLLTLQSFRLPSIS